MISRIRPYLAVVRYGFHHIAAYKSETIAMIFYKIIRISVLLFLWGFVLKDAAVGYSTKEMLSYILVVNGLQVILGAEYMRGAREITKDVKSGQISTYLLRPIYVPLFEFILDRGKRVVELVLAAIEIAAGLILTAPSLSALGPFIYFSLTAAVIAFGLNVVVGSFAFWTTEAGGIKNAFSHTVKIFGGTFIPIDLFPGILKALTLASPFPYMAYYPAVFLNKGPSAVPLNAWLISGFWAVGLLLLSKYIWKKGLAKYEAVGI